jgi:hypothetical protein
MLGEAFQMLAHNTKDMGIGLIGKDSTIVKIVLS